MLAASTLSPLLFPNRAAHHRPKHHGSSVPLFHLGHNRARAGQSNEIERDQSRQQWRERQTQHSEAGSLGLGFNSRTIAIRFLGSRRICVMVYARFVLVPCYAMFYADPYTMAGCLKAIPGQFCSGTIVPFAHHRVSPLARFMFCFDCMLTYAPDLGLSRSIGMGSGVREFCVILFYLSSFLLPIFYVTFDLSACLSVCANEHECTGLCVFGISKTVSSSSSSNSSCSFIAFSPACRLAAANATLSSSFNRFSIFEFMFMLAARLWY